VLVTLSALVSLFGTALFCLMGILCRHDAVNEEAVLLTMIVVCSVQLALRSVAFMAVLAEKLRTAPVRRQAERTQRSTVNEGLLDLEDEDEESEAGSDESGSESDDGSIHEEGIERNGLHGDHRNGLHGDDQRNAASEVAGILQRLKKAKSELHLPAVETSDGVGVDATQSSSRPGERCGSDHRDIASAKRLPLKSRELLHKSAHHLLNQSPAFPGAQSPLSAASIDPPLLVTSRRRIVNDSSSLERQPRQLHQQQSQPLPSHSDRVFGRPLVRLDPSLQEQLSQLVELVCITTVSNAKKKKKQKR
jgi:hypothetical protein